MKKHLNLVLLLLAVFNINYINDPSFINGVFNLQNFALFENQNPDLYIGYNTTHEWSTINDDVNTIYNNENIEVKIYATPDVIGDYYYLISEELLTSTELNNATWTKYVDPIILTSDVPTLVYAKYETIEGTFYVNSDYFVVDQDNPIGIIKIGTYETDPLIPLPIETFVIKDNNEVIIEVNEQYENINYYLTSEDLDFENILLNDWQTFTSLNITNRDPKYLYVQITDKAGNTSYLRTGQLSVNAYKSTLKIDGEPNNNNVTVNSSVNYNYYYKTTTSLVDTYYHVFEMNKVLPKNTVLTLFDHTFNKVYQYKILNNLDDYGFSTNGYASYPFELFKDVTKIQSNEYVESLQYIEGELIEDYTLTIDYLDTNQEVNNLNTNVTLSLYDSNNDLVYGTLSSTVVDHNLYYEVEEERVIPSLTLTANNLPTQLLYNTNQTTTINLKTVLSNYVHLEDFIYDTTLVNKKVGLEIMVVDSNDNVVSKDNLRGLIINLNDIIYTPNQDGVTRITLTNSAMVNSVLKLITFTNQGLLSEGDYELKIKTHVSLDGYYNNNYLNSNVLSIPVSVGSQFDNSLYSFGLINNLKIIVKQDLELYNNYKIIYQGDLLNPNIRVSLYEKQELTAYNQDYVLVDLKDYLKETLEYDDNSRYYVTKVPKLYVEPHYDLNNLSLEWDTKEFNNNAYRLHFELFDEDILVGSFNENFIVREGRYE